MRSRPRTEAAAAGREVQVAEAQEAQAAEFLARVVLALAARGGRRVRNLLEPLHRLLRARPLQARRPL